MFDEEDEMNMSMESGVNPRFSGLTPESPIKKVGSTRESAVNVGLTEAVMEVDEEEDPRN